MTRKVIAPLFAALALGATGAQAQTEPSYPSKPIRMVVPYPAGGPVDAAARQIAKGMSGVLKQPVVIDNKPGAGSTIGTADVAKATPDGYTVLFTLPDSFTYVPQLFKRLPYDPIKDLAPISQIALTPPVLVLRSDAGVASLKQLGPGGKTLNFGTWGPGTYPHLIASALARHARADITIVAYKGGAPAVQDFMGGHIQMAIAGIPQAIDMQQKGIARIVALAGSQRSPLIADVPTFIEQGFNEPTFAIPIWIGMAAPAKTPDAVVNKLRDAALVALRSPDTQKFLSDFGWTALGNTPAEFQAALRREAPIVANAMREAGVQPE
jgi:tripartite-type tricarboxylate transporter receptor subunit TctC